MTINRGEVSIVPWFDNVMAGSRMRGWVVRRRGTKLCLGRETIDGPLEWMPEGMASLFDTSDIAERRFVEFTDQAVTS